MKTTLTKPATVDQRFHFKVYLEVFAEVYLNVMHKCFVRYGATREVYLHMNVEVITC